MFIGVPIGFAMGFASICGFFVLGGNISIIPTKLVTGIDNFTFVAIPFFILAAELMSVGEITIRIVDFSNKLVGHITGGLAHVNVLGSLFFGGISGAASADIAGPGKIEFEMMTKAGFPKDFSAAITAASAVLAPIIPPSLIMIMYCVVAGNLSVAAMFLGGIIPGILIAISLMMICYIIAKKNNFPKEPKFAGIKKVVKSFYRMFPAIFMPILMMGGILSGVFTPTESAVVSVIYAILVSTFVLKTMSWKKFYICIIKTAKATSNIMFMIAIAAAMGWVIMTLRVPQKVSEFIMKFANSQLSFLFYSNILLLIIGTMVDMGPAVLIMTPILLPTAMKFGLSPIHFGLVLVINLCIGLITPPVGMILFVSANVLNINLSRLYKAIIPFIFAEIAVLIIVTYVPWVTTFIPKALGY
jgi:tripartite ATP-independent transporter DctM subunit